MTLLGVNTFGQKQLKNSLSTIINSYLMRGCLTSYYSAGEAPAPPVAKHNQLGVSTC